VAAQCGERVRDGGGLDGEDPVGVVLDVAADLDPALEVGVVPDRHLHEHDVAGVGDVVVVDDLGDLPAVLRVGVSGRVVGNESDGASGAVAKEGGGPGVVGGPGGA